MLRARHYAEALLLAALSFQILHGLNRLALVFRRYEVNVDEIQARLESWGALDSAHDRAA